MGTFGLGIGTDQLLVRMLDRMLVPCVALHRRQLLDRRNFVKVFHLWFRMIVFERSFVLLTRYAVLFLAQSRSTDDICVVHFAFSLYDHL